VYSRHGKEMTRTSRLLRISFFFVPRLTPWHVRENMPVRVNSQLLLKSP